MTRPNRPFVVRPCRLGDVTGISGVLKASWHAAHDHILGQRQSSIAGQRLYSRLNLAIFIAQSILWPRASTILVATRDGDAVGYAMAQRDAAEIVLYTLYVHPDWQGRGIGSALLDAAIAAHTDAAAIRLEVLKDNAAAIAWYKTRGFAIYGETGNATGLANVAALYMDRKLDRTGSPDPAALTGGT